MTVHYLTLMAAMLLATLFCHLVSFRTECPKLKVMINNLILNNIRLQHREYISRRQAGHDVSGRSSVQTGIPAAN